MTFVVFTYHQMAPAPRAMRRIQSKVPRKGSSSSSFLSSSSAMASMALVRAHKKRKSNLFEQPILRCQLSTCKVETKEAVVVVSIISCSSSFLLSDIESSGCCRLCTLVKTRAKFEVDRDLLPDLKRLFPAFLF